LDPNPAKFQIPTENKLRLQDFKLWNFYLKYQPGLLTLGYTSISRNMKKMLLADQLRS
jgi:hypothetical protein